MREHVLLHKWIILRRYPAPMELGRKTPFSNEEQPGQEDSLSNGNHIAAHKEPFS
jgi:hypothetical protein